MTFILQLEQEIQKYQKQLLRRNVPEAKNYQHLHFYFKTHLEQESISDKAITKQKQNHKIILSQSKRCLGTF